MAYQIAFDMYDSATQQFLLRVQNALRSTVPLPQTDPKKAGDEKEDSNMEEGKEKYDDYRDMGGMINDYGKGERKTNGCVNEGFMPECGLKKLVHERIENMQTCDNIQFLFLLI